MTRRSLLSLPQLINRLLEEMAKELISRDHLGRAFRDIGWAVAAPPLGAFEIITRRVGVGGTTCISCIVMQIIAVGGGLDVHETVKCWTRTPKTNRFSGHEC